MRCFVASDDSALAARLSAKLGELGYECPASQVWSLDLALSRMSSLIQAAAAEQKPPGAVSGVAATGNLLFVAFSPDAERALEVVRVIHLRLPVQIIAVGPTTNTKLLLRALREGADEYLDQADLENELTSAMDRLKTSIVLGEIAVVMSASGGTGCSTLAANLAVELAQSQKSSALVDLRLETGDLAALLDLKPTYSIVDLCRNLARLDYSLLQGCLIRHASGVQLLAAPARPVVETELTGEGLAQVLLLLGSHFPFVVVDIGTSFRRNWERVLLQADMVIVSLRLDFASLRNTHAALEYLQEIGVPREHVRLVACYYGQPNEVGSAQAEEALGCKIADFIPDDPKSVNRANNNGIPVVLQSPSAKVSRSIAGLAAQIAAKRAARE